MIVLTRHVIKRMKERNLCNGCEPKMHRIAKEAWHSTEKFNVEQYARFLKNNTTEVRLYKGLIFIYSTKDIEMGKITVVTCFKKEKFFQVTLKKAKWRKHQLARRQRAHAGKKE